MLEQIAWNTFECTGNIETYMLYRQLEEDQTDETEEKLNKRLVFYTN